MLGDLWQDLRYGLRVLGKNPGFTLIAVVTLSLGIGANTAIFSLVNSILLRPLPYREPDRLVRLIQANPSMGLDTWGVSQANFAAYREQNRSFEKLALMNNGGVNMTGEGDPGRAGARPRLPAKRPENVLARGWFLAPCAPVDR